MSGLCQGFGLYGYGSNSGVVAELISLGAMDAYLIKGASVTFFRFRYARYTNFAMEAVGQPFNTQPIFGGHSQITLNRVGDLIYYMYVCIELPGICAVRVPRGNCGFGEDVCGDSCGFRGGQFPAALDRPYDGYEANGCTACTQRGYAGCVCKDRSLFRKIGREYRGGCASPDVCAPNCDPCDPEVGKAVWLKRNYGACYNPEVDDLRSECNSVPQDERPWCHWANAIGQLLIRRAVLVVGGHQTDTLYSDYLYMWEELAGKAGKRLREMIGKRKSRRQLIRDARQAQRFYVPLPWWFTITSGNALPLCTLQFHGVQVHIEWERLSKCVIVSHNDIVVTKCVDGTKLTNNDLIAWLDTTYIYLDIEERNRFSLANFDQLITQVQFHSVTTKNGGHITVPIPFNHPVIELIWAARRRCHELKNNYFNYSGIDGRDPIEEVALRLNNLLRFSGREGKYYRLVQPYQFHSSIPKAYVYCYSFALFPEEPQPSGSLNLSRIDNVDMTFCLQEGLGCEEVTILIFARNWNIVRYTEGLAGPLFNS